MKLKICINLFILAIALTACGKDKQSSNPALQGMCQLDEPIEVPEDKREAMVFTEVSLDSTISYPGFDQYDAQKNPYYVSIFRIKENDYPTDHFGMQIGLQTSRSTVGFANNYRGNTNFTQKMEGNEEIQILVETQDEGTTHPTVMRLAAGKTKIYGASLTYPTKNGGAYTGETKTVCVRSMKLN